MITDNNLLLCCHLQHQSTYNAKSTFVNEKNNLNNLTLHVTLTQNDRVSVIDTARDVDVDAE